MDYSWSTKQDFISAEACAVYWTNQYCIVNVAISYPSYNAKRTDSMNLISIDEDINDFRSRIIATLKFHECK